MKTEKIVAESIPLALKMVRQQLGENAIIVNTRAIKTGGVFGFFAKQKYEVTAYSVDTQPALPQAKAQERIQKQPESLSQPLAADTAQSQQAAQTQKRPPKLYGYHAQNQAAPKVEESFSAFANPAVIFEKQESQTAPAEWKETIAPMEELQREEPVKPAMSIKQQIEQDSSNQLFDELQAMKKMMMSFMMNEKQSSSLPAGLTKWVNRLKKQGVEEEVIDQILEAILNKQESLSDTSDDVLKDELIAIIENMIRAKIPASYQIDQKVRMINVVGPTGVGKTTTIAKLATEQVLRQKRRVAMITTDVYRIGAVEQLKTYAGILNVPIEVVRSASELNAALNKLEHYDLVYMDTTGRNYKEAQYRDAINEYLHHSVPSDDYLVLSMTTKYEDMQVLLEEFQNSPIQKVILTKLDETNSYGAILNIANRYPYQIAYITNGQSVPEDIMPLDAGTVARNLLGEE